MNSRIEPLSKTNGHHLFKSVDDGVTWDGVPGFNDNPSLSKWCYNFAPGTPDGPKCHSVQVDPTNPKRMLLGLSGGARAQTLVPTSEEPMSHANHALWMARFRDRAKALKRHIVLPEGRDDRTLQAAQLLLDQGLCLLTLLGDPADMTRRATALGLGLEVRCSPAPSCPPPPGSLAWWRRAVCTISTSGG